MTNDNYYRCLNVMDRIDEEIKKQGTKRAFSLALGKCGVYWDNRIAQACIIRPPVLNRIAKQLNLSISYLLEGKNRQKYKPSEINYSFMLKKYNELASLKMGKIPKNMQAVICYMKARATKNISLQTLFDLSEILKIKPFDVAFRELDNE